VALGVAALAVLVAGTVVGRAPSTAAPLVVVDVVVGAVGLALFPFVARWPIPITVALTVLAALSAGATPTATAATLQVARVRQFRTAVLMGVGGVLAHAVQGLWRPTSGLSYGWWLVLVAAAYAALIGWGALIRTRHALIVSLEERARRAEAERDRRVIEARLAERTQMAREMHDVLAHRLTLLATYAGALEYRPDAPPERLAEAAGVVRSGVRQALEELREVISVLRDADPTADDERGPQPGLADLPRLVAEATDAGLAVKLDDRLVDAEALPAASARTAYRIVQEGLTNARKHARGEAAEVTLTGRPGERLEIEVWNRVGAYEAELPGAGMGLLGLNERVQLAGGGIEHGLDGSGRFRLRAWLPWPV
jgi:signal transduction histidine kinase